MPALCLGGVGAEPLAVNVAQLENLEDDRAAPSRPQLHSPLPHQVVKLHLRLLWCNCTRLQPW